MVMLSSGLTYQFRVMRQDKKGLSQLYKMQLLRDQIQVYMILTVKSFHLYDLTEANSH
jgi:hypothetical protein